MKIPHDDPPLKFCTPDIHLVEFKNNHFYKSGKKWLQNIIFETNRIDFELFLIFILYSPTLFDNVEFVSGVILFHNCIPCLVQLHLQITILTMI